LFNSEQPSKKYIALEEYYRSLHTGKETNENKEQIYNGKATMVFAKILKQIIEKNKSKTLLDYGSGKGDRYFNKSFFGNEDYPPLQDYWNIKPTLFDPGVLYPKPVNQLFDIVISIDVLEHIPFEDLNWVINEIFSFAKQIIFLNVACYPAERTFPDGTNLHVSLFPPLRWYGLISSIASNYNKKCFLVCSSIKDGNFIYDNYSINDDFKNYIN